MTHYSFSLKDQISFAELSGDYNPVHIDPVKARRTNFGSPVVHGVHALLWALENLVAKESGYLKLVSLKTHFNKAISLDEVVKFVIKSYEKNFADIQLLSENGQVVRIRASFSPSKNKEPALGL